MKLHKKNALLVYKTLIKLVSIRVNFVFYFYNTWLKGRFSEYESNKLVKYAANHSFSAVNVAIIGGLHYRINTRAVCFLPHNKSALFSLHN